MLGAHGENPVDIDGIHAHRFRCSADILTHFQKVLERLPRDESSGRFRFCELAAYLIRPSGSELNQLSHIVFPKSILLLPDSDVSLQYHAATTFPRITLLAETESNDLYFNVTSFRRTEDGHIERLSLIVPHSKVMLVGDLWIGFGAKDKRHLKANGFGAGISIEQWGQLISTCAIASPPLQMPTSELQIRSFRELPVSFNQKGAIGTTGSYNCMPQFILSSVANNRFFYDEETPVDDERDRLYEIGDIHSHSLVNDMDPLQRVVADLVGEDLVRRHPSIPDIYSRRSSRAVFGALSELYDRPLPNTMTSFAGVVAVDGSGYVQGARYFDFYNTDTKYIADLNDRAYHSMYKSGSPDPHLIAEHYRYVASVCTDDFGVEGMSDHVGDPDYDRAQDSSLDPEFRQ